MNQISIPNMRIGAVRLINVRADGQHHLNRKGRFGKGTKFEFFHDIGITAVSEGGGTRSYQVIPWSNIERVIMEPIPAEEPKKGK